MRVLLSMLWGLALVILSCKESSSNENDISATDELEYVYTYWIDDNNYDYQVYNKSGIVKEIGHIRDGNLDGSRFEYHKNGKVHIENSYWAGILHGPQRKYNENGVLLIEELFIMNRPIIRKRRQFEPDYEHYWYRVTIINDTSHIEEYPIGYYTLDSSSGKPIDSLTNYYFVEAKDSISMDGLDTVYVNYIIPDPVGTSGTLFLGKLDNKLLLQDTALIVPFTDRCAQVSIDPGHIGDTLITGVIEIVRSDDSNGNEECSLHSAFIFYRKLYIKD